MISLRYNASRNDAREKLRESGLLWDDDAGSERYWSETEHICFDLATAEVLEDAANEAHQLSLQACEEVVSRGWLERLAIPDAASPLVEASWREKDLSLYGRFDFAWDGQGSPKLLEYNADTPTTLLEAAVLQWQWLEELFPNDDQLNSLHEALIEQWQKIPEIHVHLACAWGAIEDRQTIAYLAETAEQAGKSTQLLDMAEIGYDATRAKFTDGDEREISRLFKLYPWEWMAQEEFFPNVAANRAKFTEPIWKMMLANKGMLAILWELFPNHPLLVPAFFEEQTMRASSATAWVSKPFWGREGSGISFRDSYGETLRGDGEHANEPHVFQQKTPLWQDLGRHFVWGLWMVGDSCRGLSARGDTSPITSNRSRFYPHRLA